MFSGEKTSDIVQEFSVSIYEIFSGTQAVMDPNKTTVNQVVYKAVLRCIIFTSFACKGTLTYQGFINPLVQIAKKALKGSKNYLA